MTGQVVAAMKRSGIADALRQTLASAALHRGYAAIPAAIVASHGLIFPKTAAFSILISARYLYANAIAAGARFTFGAGRLRACQRS